MNEVSNKFCLPARFADAEHYHVRIVGTQHGRILRVVVCKRHSVRLSLSRPDALLPSTDCKRVADEALLGDCFVTDHPLSEPGLRYCYILRRNIGDLAAWACGY